MSSRSSRRLRPLALLGAGIVVLLVGILIGGHPQWLPSPLRSVFVSAGDGGTEGEALDVLTQDYFRKVDRRKLIDEGLRAAVASLDDPYSRYFSPAEYRDFLAQGNPHLSGIGIDVQPDPRGLKIIDVFPGSPAAHAGLASGAVITEVGSQPLEGKPAELGPQLIKGPPGSEVRLTVIGSGQQRVLTIRRAKITIPVAEGTVVSSGPVKLGVVRLTTFTEGAGEEVKAQVKHVLEQGARGLVLDLRANGGGLLEEAVNVASVFIADGTIVSTEGRSQPRQVYVARGGAVAPSLPIVVLVDHGTASSSEIVTGALRDRRQAKVVGTRTYGKGVFQEIRSLSDGSALELVTGRWFEPSGHNVGGPGVTEGRGIAPDISASTSPRGAQDQALRAAERVVAAEVQ